jgi:hypothetical protein
MSQKHLTDFKGTKELALKNYVNKNMKENRKGKGEDFPLEVFKNDNRLFISKDRKRS